MTTAIYVNGNEHLEDFWTDSNERLDEEERNATTDEGELESDWLEAVGLGEWTVQWRQGKSLPENDIAPAVQKLSLKPHQADALRRRVRTLNATLKRKKNKRQTPDVRSFFQHEDNKDSSRSETPDSLDSNESLNDSPPRRNSPSYLKSYSPQNDMEDGHGGNHNNLPNFVQIFANEQPIIVSSPSRPKDIFKPQFLFNGRGNSSSSCTDEIATDVISGIEILNYHNVGTIYMKGYIPKHHQRHHENLHPCLSLPPIDSRTYTANPPPVVAPVINFIPQSKNGFIEELRKNSSPTSSDEEELVDENSYVEPSGLTRLNDLSEEDVKKIRPLLLMELTAQCDHVNIQVRMKKPSKNQNQMKKNSLGGSDQENVSKFFGIPLETLLQRDRQKFPDSNLEVPILFEKLLSHLWKKSLSEEGLLRIAGHKGKINELRATIESSLYELPEQVDNAMKNCSSHDVANLLKQFLRELPIPLLGFEYIDVFYEVAGQLRGRSQESCLRLLILLLPQSHQAVLRQLVQFLRDLVKNSDANKMCLQNVATILAPNLAPNCALQARNKELTRAATWVKLTQNLIRHGTNLFYIPSDLVSQLRQINDLSRQKKKGKQNGGVMGKCIHPQTASVNSNSFNNLTGSSSNGNGGHASCNYITVSAPQLGFPEVLLPISSAGTTAGDIVLLLLDEADKKAEEIEANFHLTNNNNGNNNNNGIRRRNGPRPQELNKNGPNLSCLLSKMNKDMALKTHSLYEIGGNIGYRKIDPCALLPAICRDNPSAAWVLRCNHRHSSNV